jgi:hypothetical protein
VGVTDGAASEVAPAQRGDWNAINNMRGPAIPILEPIIRPVDGYS